MKPLPVLMGIVLFSMMLGCTTTTGPLATLPMVSPEASEHNLAGIKEYDNGNWESAKSQFEAALQADPNLSEAHFNLALTLHKLGDHEKATEHFRMAGELEPQNREIVESTIYRNHLGLSSTLEATYQWRVPLLRRIVIWADGLSLGSPR